jgi:hypothetical protein
LGELSRKPYLEAPQLAEAIVCLCNDLLIRSEYFSCLAERNLNYLLFALFRYPLRSKILDCVCSFFKYAEMAFSSALWQ